MPKKVDDCVKKVMAGGKKQAEAFAICNESVSKNQDGIGMVPVPAIRPVPEMPKHDQDYCGYTETSLFPNKICANCMFFIKGNGDSDNQCQLIKDGPKRIVEEGFCRFFRSFSDLEGFIPIPIETDDSMPSDVRSMLGDKDVKDKDTKEEE